MLCLNPNTSNLDKYLYLDINISQQHVWVHEIITIIKILRIFKENNHTLNHAHVLSSHFLFLSVRDGEEEAARAALRSGE